MKNKFILFLATTITLLLTGCKKDLYEQSNSMLVSDLNTKHQTEQIPYYNSTEELFNTINIAVSFNELSDLINYEKNRGQASIGRKSDEFYKTITPDKFENEEAAINFCLENSQYIDTTMSANGDIYVSPKWSDSPFRYAANTNGLFQVGNYITRIFKKGAITTHINNIELLNILNEDTYDDADPDIFIKTHTYNSTKTVSHYGCLPSSVPFADTSRKGSDYMMILRIFSEDLITDPDNPTVKLYRMVINIQNKHKVAGIWWAYDNLITCSGSMTPHYDNIGSDIWYTQVCPISFTAVRKNAQIIALSFYGNTNCKIHHYEYNLSLTSVGYPTAQLQYTHP